METVEKPNPAAQKPSTLKEVFPLFPQSLENSSLTLIPAEFPTVHTASTTTTHLKKGKTRYERCEEP
jgi:hypothetical protein